MPAQSWYFVLEDEVRQVVGRSRPRCALMQSGALSMTSGI